MHHDSTPVTLDLGNHCIVTVDAGDVDRIKPYAWYVNRAKGRPDYVCASVGGRRNRRNLYLHRLVIDAPGGSIVDHINGDTMDNRRSNLRIATHQQNMANSKKRRHNSGYKGVGLRCDGKKWIARIQFNGRGIYLGSFDTPEDAARAYDAKARELFGEFARPNFPE